MKVLAGFMIAYIVFITTGGLYEDMRDRYTSDSYESDPPVTEQWLSLKGIYSGMDHIVIGLCPDGQVIWKDIRND